MPKSIRMEEDRLVVIRPVDRMRRMRRKSNGAAFSEKARHKCAGGEHTGAGRGCKGRPQCGTVHEKTERRNKNRQHANSQQRDDRVKEYTAWHHGSILRVKCVVERPELGMDGRQERDHASKIKFMRHFQKNGNVWCIQNESHSSFLNQEKVYLFFFLSYPRKSVFTFREPGLFCTIWVAPPVLHAKAAWIQLPNLYNLKNKTVCAKER